MLDVLWIKTAEAVVRRKAVRKKIFWKIFQKNLENQKKAVPLQPQSKQHRLGHKQEFIEKTEETSTSKYRK